MGLICACTARYVRPRRVEAGCLLVYVLDCIAKIAAIGMANFFMCDTYRQPWDHFRVLVVRQSC